MMWNVAQNGSAGQLLHQSQNDFKVKMAWIQFTLFHERERDPIRQEIKALVTPGFCRDTSSTGGILKWWFLLATQYLHFQPIMNVFDQCIPSASNRLPRQEASCWESEDNMPDSSSKQVLLFAFGPHYIHLHSVWCRRNSLVTASIVLFSRVATHQWTCPTRDNCKRHFNGSSHLHARGPCVGTTCADFTRAKFHCLSI